VRYATVTQSSLGDSLGAQVTAPSNELLKSSPHAPVSARGFHCTGEFLGIRNYL